MMTLQGKEGLNSVDWRAMAELIAASGLGQRDISYRCLNRPFATVRSAGLVSTTASWLR